MKALVALLSAALIAAACSAPATSSDESSPVSGDPARGERAYQKCYSCHALEPARNDIGGPTLHRIIGRRVAGEGGFDYSPALRKFAKRHPGWTPALLDQLVADPEALVPGTSMTFVGIADTQERKDLIAYLERADERTP